MTAPALPKTSALSAPVRRLFGTDGIRGVANADLSPQLALDLGAATGRFLQQQYGAGNIPPVLMGKDGRASGDLLGAALASGLCAFGVSVVSLGIVPTPGVAILARDRKASLGVVISASHNPVKDNGIKFFGPDGKKLPDAIEAQIEQLMDGWASLPRPTGADVGKITRETEAAEDYLAHLQRTAGGRLDGLRLVIDGANGAASPFAQRLFESLGATVTPLFCSPNGANINEQCGSLHPETMAAKVVEAGAHAGMAFDGDADRVIFADEKGQIFDGDRILFACGVTMAQKGELTNRTVVGTVMSNLGLEKALGNEHIRLVRAPVGDRYVTEQMQEHNAVLGGEKSGHILFPTLSPTGDGMLTALQVLRLLQETNSSLSRWAEAMPEYPQKLVNVYVRDKNGWDEIPEVQTALQKSEAFLAGKGRLVVRPSGTEKMIRVMAEAPTQAEVNEAVEIVASVVQAHLGI